MTKLLDSGYLETDDPVVAALFLDEDVLGFDDERQEWLIYLIEVGKDHLFAEDKYIEYPIRIPAKTVANVCGIDTNSATTRQFLMADILSALWDEERCDYSTGSVYDWIAKHIKKTINTTPYHGEWRPIEEYQGEIPALVTNGITTDLYTYKYELHWATHFIVLPPLPDKEK